MRSALWLLLFAAPLAAQQPEPATVSISVLSLFHPQTLTLTTAARAQLLLEATAVILPANTPLTVRSAGGSVTVQLPGGVPRSAMQLTLPATTFTLTVPGKLTRTYAGSLTITSVSMQLQAVIVMPTESVVASIVAAELPADAAPEALKAQAIVARSFLLAIPHRHHAFTACDTTHCQYLRAAPPPTSPAALASAATAGVVLVWQSRIVPAMYARSCGGSTRALGSAPPGAYPFFAVRCQYCQRHPERWTRTLTQAPPASEKERIAYNRVHGWDAIPSAAFTQSGDQTGNQIVGRGVGHGLGLCQAGAQSLALRGQTAATILARYFPAVRLIRLP